MSWINKIKESFNGSGLDVITKPQGRNKLDTVATDPETGKGCEIQFTSDDKGVMPAFKGDTRVCDKAKEWYSKHYGLDNKG